MNKIFFAQNRKLREFNDWFLPSKDELDAMRINLYLEGVGGFIDTTYYWCSSEGSSTLVWSQRFNDGSQGLGSKSVLRLTRACRKFTDNIGAYSLRDTGPAGGLIFYISGITYYEAAPSDQSSGYAWSNIDDVAIGTTGTAIGTGKQNTLDIINQSGHTTSAAKLCNDLITN